MEGGLFMAHGFVWRKLFFFLAMAFFCGPELHQAAAKEVRYKDYPVEIRDGDRVVFTGLKANVRLIPSANPKSAVFRVRKSIADKPSADDLARFDAMSFAVRRD